MNYWQQKLSLDNQLHAGLWDSYGRKAQDLRVSLTDRCNLRCQYCMPEEGLPFLVKDSVLTDDEVIRLIRIGVEKLGISKVRFTGGEPLLRKGLEGIISATAALCTNDGDKLDISLTTNALGLEHRAEKLRNSGLQRVNISLDSASRYEFRQLTRRDRFNDVLRGIEAAVAAGLNPIKINAVIIPGINDSSMCQLLVLALRLGAQLRFIEHMPIGPVGKWEKAKIVSSQELIKRLQIDFQISPVESARGSSPATLWSVAAGRYAGEDYPRGTVGFISSVSEPFCGQCDRVRLTAEGHLRSCLFSDDEYDLRPLLRDGATDEQIASVWQEVMRRKPAGHGISREDFIQPKRTMSAIGG